VKSWRLLTDEVIGGTTLFVSGRQHAKFNDDAGKSTASLGFDQKTPTQSANGDRVVFRSSEKFTNVTSRYPTATKAEVQPEAKLSDFILNEDERGKENNQPSGPEKKVLRSESPGADE